MNTPEQVADLTKRLREIKERADRATRGPWACKSDEPGHHPSFSSAEHIKLGGEGGCNLMFLVPVDDNDAAFIAHAREDVPFLLDTIADLESRLRRVRELCDEAENADLEEVAPGEFRVALLSVELVRAALEAGER